MYARATYRHVHTHARVCAMLYKKAIMIMTVMTNNNAGFEMTRYKMVRWRGYGAQLLGVLFAQVSRSNPASNFRVGSDEWAAFVAYYWVWPFTTFGLLEYLLLLLSLPPSPFL